VIELLSFSSASSVELFEQRRRRLSQYLQTYHGAQQQLDFEKQQASH